MPLKKPVKNNTFTQVTNMNLNLNIPYACGEFIDNTIGYIPIINDTMMGPIINFPILNDKQTLNTMLQSASDAYFGKNDQAVLDPFYRSAKVIHPNQFYTNFDPNNYNIIDQIQAQMGEVNIKLIKDKLNIYSTGDHFRIHKDTPKSPNMIGTLVICFPSSFTGGDLILHTQPNTTFSFQHLSSTHFQWCSFYGDIDHEITPVTSGYRITLTFDIIKCHPTLSPNKKTIECIETLLNDPTILPNGGFLGYGCKYMYSFTSINDIVFKGIDSLIYNSFKTFGIDPVVEQLSFFIEPNNLMNYYCNLCDMNGVDIVNRNFKADFDICLECSKTPKGIEKIKQFNIGSIFYIAPTEKMYVDAENMHDMMKQTGSRLINDIYWITTPYDGEQKKAIESDILYGNHPTSHEKIYKRCVLLMYIPDLEKRKQKEFSNVNNVSYITTEDEELKEIDDEDEEELQEVKDENRRTTEHDECSFDEEGKGIKTVDDVIEMWKR